MNERMQRLADYIVGARGETVDYYKLGETTGKAWRLGHMGEKGSAQNDAAIEAAKTLLEPTTSESSEVLFYKGFFEGVQAVDKDAQQPYKSVDYAELGRRCATAWMVGLGGTPHRSIVVGKARAVANDLALAEPAHSEFMNAFIAVLEA